MKEFIEKLIGRLEEKSVEHRETGFEMERKGFSNIADKQYAKQTTYLKAISIVNQLAEEYKNESVKGDLISRSLLLDCLSYYISHTDEKSGEHYAYERAKDLIEKQPKSYNDGWIPCSERLPSERDWYLAVFKEGDSDFVLVPRVADYIGKETVCTTNEGWLIIDLEDEIGINAYYKNLVCIAWQPLPEPYIG